MSPISESLTLAIQHHQAGRLGAAEAIYRQILQSDPNQHDAIHLLGVIARQVGMHDAAVELIGRAIQLKGNVAEFHNNLGGAYLDLRRLSEAESSFRRAVQLKPDYAVAHSNLGNVLREQGNLDDAISSCRQAVRLNANYADAHVNLGNAQLAKGNLDHAVTSYRRAIELNPNAALTHSNLGNALKDQGKLDQAVASYQCALERQPDLAEAHNNLGNALKDLGRSAEAVAFYHQAIQRKPDYAEAYNNLGNVLVEQEHLDEAILCCRRALELKPDYAAAYTNLGNALLGQGKLDESIACYRRVLELTPEDAQAYTNLANPLQVQGKWEEATNCRRKALDLRPNFAEAHSNLLLTLQYVEQITQAKLLDAHADFDRRHATGLRGTTVPKIVDPSRLRLGFVSADLGRHPVGYFLVGVLEQLRQQQVETVCYSDRIVKDDLTRRIQSAVSEWRDVKGLGDEALADQIRSDQIDVLFDLAGHTAQNRMLVFARKPAPIQITWAGYASTTGLSAIDYILADRYEIPPDAEWGYRERVLRMPDGYICYEPPVYAPVVGPLPALNTGRMTFGCFNNPAKITSKVIDVWSAILEQSPGSRLVLQYKGWNDPGVAGRFIDELKHRIDPDRLEFVGQTPHAECLASYNRIDLALDPFPYSGGLTTCEALWMGVPVITCPGETFASRHSLSHLSNIGLTETIANDLDQYIERAVSLANDLPRLSNLRAGLRQRMADSPLCDAKRFTIHLISLLRAATEHQRGSADETGN